ncbi:MAG: sensor histidine kinase [Devosia sp.]
MMALTAQLFRTAFARAIWLLLVISFLYASPGYAADPWRIEDLAVLVDKSGQESIASVSQPSRAAGFSPAPNGFSAGYTRAVHWLRFTLNAPPPDEQGKREILLEVHPPYLDDLQIYLSKPDADGEFDVRRGGDLLPQSAKEHPYRGFVYRISFEDAKPRTAYMRLQTSSSSVLIVKAWEPRRFVKQAAREYAVLGVLLGFIVAGLLANFWHGQLRREAIYRRYVAFLAATLFHLFGINGLAGEFILPHSPFWASQWVSLGTVLIVLLGFRFYMLALDIQNAAHWIRWVYRIQIGLAVVSLPMPFLGLYPETASILLHFAFITLLTGAWRSVQLWRQHNANGRILLLAHTISVAGHLSVAPALLGLLPGQFWLVYGFQLSSLATLLTLQLMLGQHVRVMQAKLNQARTDIEIAKATAQQERAEREQQRHFLSMLTHELKTPLSVIRLRLGATTPTLRMQAHANQAVEDINAIVERCASVSQIDDGAGTPQNVPCDIGELLSELLAQQQATERVSLKLQEDALAAPLHCDPLLLRTLLSNLIDNAIKYSPPDSTTQITCTLSPEAERNGIRIEVGSPVGNVGMPDPAQVFQKYYRAPGAHRHSGCGLGLYIVKALTQQLGGAIDYHPHTDRVTFALWLPT